MGSHLSCYGERWHQSCGQGQGGAGQPWQVVGCQGWVRSWPWSITPWPGKLVREKTVKETVGQAKVRGGRGVEQAAEGKGLRAAAEPSPSVQVGLS